MTKLEELEQLFFDATKRLKAELNVYDTGLTSSAVGLSEIILNLSKSIDILKRLRQEWKDRR